MSKVPSYGSVNDATESSYFTAKAGSGTDDEEIDRNFDADQTYYLRSGSSLTFKQRVRKYTTAAVPILFAVLIMGFFTFYLLRNLSHLYPTRGGDSLIKKNQGHTTTVSVGNYHTDDQRSQDRATGSRPGELTDNAVKAIPSKSDVNASCSSHPNCVNLIGNCCPAANGIMLDCCN